MNTFGMESLDDCPSHPMFNDFLDLTTEQRTESFLVNVRTVVDKHFNFTTSKSHDSVLSYAEEVFSLGLFLMEFIDSVHEGDGNRILRCWRYMLLMFKASNKTKYSVEAFNALVQYHFVFNDKLRNQLLWSRTTNVHGKKGKNVPMDLHMEHLNRIFKDVVSSLGPNVVDSSLQRTGKALKGLVDIQQQFDAATGITPESSYHTFTSTKKDLIKVIEKLLHEGVFCGVAGHKHKHFHSFKSTVVNRNDPKELKEWMIFQLRCIIRYSV